jgi:prophage regulatory protein
MKKILRMRDIRNITGLSRATIYLMIKKGTFPDQIKIGVRAVGWIESDLQAWIESKTSKKASNFNSPIGDLNGTKP